MCAGFTADLRSNTGGQAFPQCVFDHWQVKFVIERGLCTDGRVRRCCKAIHSTRRRNRRKLSQTHASERVSRKAYRRSITSSTNCEKLYDLSHVNCIEQPAFFFNQLSWWSFIKHVWPPLNTLQKFLLTSTTASTVTVSLLQ